MVEICALASGSNGNCYYIGNSRDAVLIDAGVSCKQVLSRMAGAGLDARKVRGIFVSHEHSDHVRGVRVLGNKLRVPVWFTQATWMAAGEPNRPERVEFFTPDKPVSIGSFTIYPFLKNHDAAEPCSFRVEHDGWQIGVFTDMGHACSNVISNLKLCHAMFLETNYDEQMLWDGPYPYPLKRRVASDVGHLSNLQAFELLRDHSGPELLHVFLSHLSGENNRPDLAEACFQSLTSRFNVRVASRETFSEVCVLR
jgi:phosphoribosyl 1,2-cyclic phosphodiesterase